MTQGWQVDATADTITFDEAPPTGTGNIVVKEIASADFNATPIWSMGAWNAEYGFPGEIEFYSDRLVCAATPDQPQTIWMSRIGDYAFFGKSTPILDDDALTATMNARQLNAIVDLIPKQHLLALTTGGVWKVGGGDSEVLTPATISTRPQPSTGAGSLASLDVGETAIYLTHKGGQVRDLAYTFEADGYAGSDLTAFASHLLKNRTLTDWSWGPEPWSAAFAVRDDGTLLTLTYKREHQVVAWARHETGGEFEASCTVAEADYHGTYVVVKRTIGGVTKRYIERLADPDEDYRAVAMLDCALSYDGRSQPQTATLTGGATVDDLVTVVLDTSVVEGSFTASNIGDEVVLYYDDEPLRITITAVAGLSEVSGYPSRALTAADLVAGKEWALAVDTLSGLGHLEGETVSVAGDGFDLGEYVVTGGSITLEKPAVLAIAGLPFTADFESLDMTVIGGESVATRNKVVKSVGILVQDTQTIAASGEGFDWLNDYKPRDSESMSLPAELKTEWLEVRVPGSWEQNPRIFIRAKGPYHAHVLAIEPNVEFGR